MEVDLRDRKGTARLAMPQGPLTSRIGNTAYRTCLHILTNKLSETRSAKTTWITNIMTSETFSRPSNIRADFGVLPFLNG